MTDLVITKPLIDDIEVARYKVLTRAEYDALRAVVSAAREVYKIHHESRHVWSREENELHTALQRLEAVDRATW